eukprot:Em0024g268a
MKQRTNASTSVVWGPDDCHSSVRQTTASAATSRGSTAKTASKRAVDTSTDSPTSKKKKLASDCSNNPVSCYRSSCGSAASTVVIGTTTNASKILASSRSSTVLASGTPNSIEEIEGTTTPIIKGIDHDKLQDKAVIVEEEVEEQQQQETAENTTLNQASTAAWDPAIRNQRTPHKDDKHWHNDCRQGRFCILQDAYPTKQYGGRGRKRAVQKSWLEAYGGPKKLFCYPCWIFNSKRDNEWIKGGHSNFKKCTGAEGSLVKHANSLDHKAAEVCLCNIKPRKEMELLSALAGPVHASKVALEKKSTREYLKIMLQAVAFLAAGGLAFRGHDESSSSSNKGNFLRLLDLLASVSPDFAKQRERHAVDQKIREELGDDLPGAVYSILADETSCVAHKEFLTLVIRYASIDKLGRHYCDDFNDTERGMLSTEVELMITEITMLHACERNFAGLKFVKNRLRSTIGDDFLDDLLTMLVENDLVDAILKADDSDTSFTQAINYFATQFGKGREKM